MYKRLGSLSAITAACILSMFTVQALASYANEINKSFQTETFTKQNAPKIEFEKTVVNVGEVASSTLAEIEFNFINAGKSPLKFKYKSKGSCCGIRYELDKAEYLPGESGAIMVKYSTGRMNRSFSKPIFVETNDPENAKVNLTIKGKTIAKIEIIPESINLLPRRENADCPEIIIRSLDNEVFSLKSFTATDDCIKADINPTSKATEFKIVPEVDIEQLPDTNRGRISISTTHPLYNTVTIPFKIQTPYQAKPSGITLLDVIPEETIKRQLWIISTYEEDFEVDSIVSEKGFITVVNKEENDKQYKVELRITAPVMSETEVNKRLFKDELTIKMADGEQLSVPCFGVYAKDKK
ncbi:MAG: DUF1573 domain-containing protein [Planctomycetota bacterium]